MEVSHLVSRPIPEDKTPKKVVITVISEDQGWSSYPGDYDTYRDGRRGSSCRFDPRRTSERGDAGRWLGTFTHPVASRNTLSRSQMWSFTRRRGWWCPYGLGSYQVPRLDGCDEESCDTMLLNSLHGFALRYPHLAFVTRSPRDLARNSDAQ